MEIQKLSNTYWVSSLEEKDIEAVLSLCQGNPLYYEHCPPAVTAEAVREDMVICPPGKGREDKYYVGFWDKQELVAVLDLIDGYPDRETAYIGFFMMNASRQGTGAGSRLVEEICDYLKTKFSAVRLCYVSTNKQSKQFWLKNGFTPTGVVAKRELYDAVVMQRML